MNNTYLLMWLEGPLQSWGFDSKFRRRDSLQFPTKSALLGLICAARGAGGAETAWLAEWADLDLQLYAYIPEDQPVQQPLLEDFHMVGSAYDDSDPWANLLIPKTDKGAKPVGSGAILTYRYYLQDIAFAAVVEMPSHMSQEVEQRLQNPIWDLYLGRKTCAPTEMIFQGIFDSSELATQAGKNLASQKNLNPYFRVLNGQHQGEVISINDIPIQFGTDKKYRDRLVTIQNSERS